jgi:23S rRNA (uracil1939-C5)-methyltransferase
VVELNIQSRSKRVVRVESLDQEGRGIARAEGKTVFVSGALPSELVTYSVYAKKPSYDLAQVSEIVRPSAMRTHARCSHFGLCGGCSMQHLDVRAQVAAKQRVLEDALLHIAKLRPGTILPAIYGQPWGYRYRARFSARYVAKKSGALVGFREKRSTHVTNMVDCKVVPPRIGALLVPLRALINDLSIRERLPQVELAIGEGTDALVLRHLERFNAQDEDVLRAFADKYRVQLFLQPRGPDSVTAFYPQHDGILSYALPEFGLQIGFSPTEFTQVNPAVNAVLVRRAVTLLQPQSGEHVADMFCGVGNFTLALARSGAAVVGYEMSRDLITRARANAQRNGFGGSVEFRTADLFRLGSQRESFEKFDKMLIDPPRDGALALVKALPENGPRRIVYVSCNPATLARDAGLLVHTRGYELSAAGVVNMFPHTSHIESVAVFDRP